MTGAEEKKRLAKNIFSLTILQVANYILPLLTIPYLVRVLGPEYFGLLAFATSTITYFVLITNYGFNLSATRQISIHRNDRDKVAEIFSAVMTIKTGLMVVSFVLMALLVFSFEKFSRHWEVYFITFGVVIGQVLFPVWLFQGMEQMKYITYLNIGAKTFFTGCIFIFVQGEADYLLVPLLTTMGFVFASFYSLYLVRNELNVNFSWQPAAAIKLQLEEGFHVFFSSMVISLYTISTTFLLGLFTNNVAVGYFAAADKIVQAVRGLYAPISEGIYPLIGKKIHEDKQAGLKFIENITWIVSAGMFVISALLFLLAGPIVDLIFGANFQQSVLLLQVMAFLPLIISLSNIYGIQTILNLGFKKEFSYILIAAAILGVGLTFTLVPVYEALGTAITILITESFVAAVMYLFLKLKLKEIHE